MSFELIYNRIRRQTWWVFFDTTDFRSNSRTLRTSRRTPMLMFRNRKAIGWLNSRKRHGYIVCRRKAVVLTERGQPPHCRYDGTLKWRIDSWFILRYYHTHWLRPPANTDLSVSRRTTWFYQNYPHNRLHQPESFVVDCRSLDSPNSQIVRCNKHWSSIYRYEDVGANSGLAWSYTFRDQ